MSDINKQSIMSIINKPSTASEEFVKIASKLYKCRKCAKFLAGEEYPTRIAQYIDVINSRCVTGIDVLKAALLISKDVEHMEGSEYTQLWVLAAAVEIIEPSI